MAILVHIQKQPDQILWKKKCITQDFFSQVYANAKVQVLVKYTKF